LYKKQLAELRNSKENLEESHAYGKISDEIYGKYSMKLENQIQELMKTYNYEDIDISNLIGKVKMAVDFSQNLSKYWTFGNLSTKGGIQNLVFPEGLVINTKDRQYLTSKVNMLFSAKVGFTEDSEVLKQKLPDENTEESRLVAGASR
jgi:site-specific DNA recombinase